MKGTPYYDMAMDAGYRGDEAIAMARQLEEQEQREAMERYELEAEAEARYAQPPCLECGAETPEQAETMCNCAGDKDDCHGCHLWPN